MMVSEFEMSMIEDLSYFIGLQIKQMKNSTFVSQGKYIKDMLKKFGMDDSKAISTPIGTNGNLDSDASGNMVDQKMYRSMIGSLLYVTASRPVVMFSVCMCARFQASPRESFESNKENIEVLEAYTKCWIVVSQRCRFELIRYSDSDYAGCKVERKSTSSTYQLLGRSLISWPSKMQNSIALSTTKAEYILASSCCAQLL